MRRFSVSLFLCVLIPLLSMSAVGWPGDSVSRSQTASISNNSGPPFKFCNKTRYKLFLAIAYWSWGAKTYGRLVSEGWWTMKPGECTRLFDDDTRDAHRWYYAHDADYNITWTVETSTDITNDKFTYENDTKTCPAGWETVGFKSFRDSDTDLTEN